MELFDEAVGEDIPEEYKIDEEEASVSLQYVLYIIMFD